MNWRDALHNIPAKGYRKRNNRYEAYVSNHSKTIMLGTYDTAEKARDAVFDYRATRLINSVNKYGLDINDGVIYQRNYVAFKNGMIFNLHGEQMRDGVGKGGYRHGIVGGRNADYHKIIADCFIENPNGLRDVNHRNGNKLDLDVTNLERTTHSDNVKHAYQTGLITPQYGEDHHNAKLTVDNIHYIRSSGRSSYRLAKELGVDSSTIRDVRRGKTWRHVK